MSGHIQRALLQERLYKLLQRRHSDLMIFFSDICCDPQRWPIHLRPIWDKYLLDLGCKKGRNLGKDFLGPNTAEDFFYVPSPSNEWRGTIAFPKDVAMKALMLGELPKMDLK